MNKTLRDVLLSFKDEIFRDLNCHAVGIIDSVDGNLANVLIAYNRFTETNEDKRIVLVSTPYPLVASCPIVRIGSSTSGLFTNVKKGDKCVLLFNDVNMDNFIISDFASTPDTKRKHSFSDGIALVGLDLDFPQYNGACLFDGEAHVLIEENKIDLKNQTESLGQLFTELITAINSITVTNNAGVTGPPNNAAQISAIGQRIRGLLK